MLANNQIEASHMLKRQPVIYYFLPMLGHNGLRMKLNTSNIILFMCKSHNNTPVIGGCNPKFTSNAFWYNSPGMIMGNLKLRRTAFK